MNKTNITIISKNTYTYIYILKKKFYHIQIITIFTKSLIGRYYENIIQTYIINTSTRKKERYKRNDKYRKNYTRRNILIFLLFYI